MTAAIRKKNVGLWCRYPRYQADGKYRDGSVTEKGKGSA